MSNVKQIHPEAPARKKVAIVGFTNSRNLTPWDDPTFEKWICNNLHKFVPDKWQRCYDLHDDATILKDPEHVAFLQKDQGRPLVVWRPRKEWPSSVGFPKDAVTDTFGRYFTNSISWMIAHAIMENAEEIHVYGVDMAQTSEYGSQRPSCEYFLGLAVGLGIKVYVPPTSDLLKVAAMYGAEDDSALYDKVVEREGELVARMNELNSQLQSMQQQMNHGQLQLASFNGALETTRYFKSVWTNARGGRDGQDVGPEGADAALGAAIAAAPVAEPSKIEETQSAVSAEPQEAGVEQQQ